MTDGNEAIRRAVAGLSPEKRALLTRELARRQAARRRSIPARPRVPGENRMAASPGQERLFFLHELDAGSTTYLMPIAVRLRGDLRPEALRAALAALVERHEALRTGFTVDPDEGLVQVILPADGVALDVTRGELDAADVESSLARFLTTPFDLALPPLLRAAIWNVQAADGGPSGEWILALCAHHIVADGWSLGVLADDLAASYRAFAADREPVLPPLPLQYADFAAWQRESLDGPALAGQVAHWTETLDGAHPLDILGDRAHPPARSFEGASTPIELPADLVGALRELGESEGATPFMTLLAGLAVVLGRWAGRSDMVIGTPVAGRPEEELEGLVGFFVNTLPLRIRLPEDESFRELLRRVKEDCLAAFAHQDVPFERIVHELAGARQGARTELLQVLLALRNVPLDPLDLPGVEADPLDLPRDATDLDLSVELAPARDGGLTGWIVYSTEIFDSATVERLVTALRVTYAAAVAEPDRAVSALPLMPPAERVRVLTELSGAMAPAVPPAFVHERFGEHAAADPEAPAVVADRGPSLSYGALDARANRLARWLIDRGVAVEDRVGVHLHRTPDLLVALLAISKAGAVYVPLDPAQPGQRLTHIIGDARPSLILSSSDVSGPAADGGSIGVARLDELDTALAEYPADAPDVLLSPDHLAYVIYTSGSTGSPKGVMISHRALANRLGWMCQEFGFTADDVTLHRTTTGADASLWELYVPLMTGGRLVLAEPFRHGDPAYVLDVIARHQVTACDFVPSLLRHVLDDGDAGERMSSLRVVVSGGEELTAELGERFCAIAPKAALHNFYGPTEAAIDVSTHPVTAPVTAPVPIGTPIRGTELYVLDGRMEPVPVGVPGELFIGGVQNARGYLGRPGPTAERFVPHPFRIGQRLYRTGDRARWRADGALDYLGRLDDQVQILGHRVEPAEVESALRAHDDLSEAVVLARPGARGEPELIAYLTVREGAEDPGADALRRFLAGRLPPAMIPSSFTRLDALPYLPSGKIDRRALAESGPSPLPRTPPAPPEDALQEVLLGIWAYRLDVTDIGIHDDFFALGGHSILATLIVAQVRDLFRIELPLHSIIDAATVAGFAGAVRQQGALSGYDVDRVAELVLKVQRMPAAEVEARLRG